MSDVDRGVARVPVDATRGGVVGDLCLGRSVVVGVVVPAVPGDAVGGSIDDAVYVDATFVPATEVGGGVTKWGCTVGDHIIVEVGGDAGGGVGRFVDGAGSGRSRS